MARKWYRTLLFGVALVAIATLTCARRPLDVAGFLEELPQLKKPPASFRKGPYLQNLTATSVTIMWQSERPCRGAVAFGPDSALSDTVWENAEATIHAVRLSGLEPGKAYRYRAVSCEGRSASGEFRTADPRDTSYTFAVYGDNKNAPFNHLRIAERILDKRPAFVVHVGDLVNRGYVDKQWDLLFFWPASRLMAEVPLYVALGNHERHAKQFFDLFALPGNEQWYSFDFGNGHFVVLDSDLKYLREGSEQLQWLVEDLRRNRATWTFVFFHHPPFTAGGNYYRKDRLERKRLLYPIFEQYGVDLVFNGHDHDYERSRPIVSRSGLRPVTYIVCGNGGTPLRYTGRREWTAYTERIFGYVTVRVNGRRLELTAHNIDDEVIDRLTIDKSSPESLRLYRESALAYEEITDPVDAIRYYKQADDLFDEDRYAEAIPWFEKAYQADTTCVEALAALAVCYAELDSIDRALDYATRAIGKKPNLPDPYETLVEVYTDLGRYEEATRWARRWYEVTPDSPDAYEALADVYEERGDLRHAILGLEKALEILPSDSDLYFKLGELCEKAGDREGALAAYRRGVWWFMDEREDKELRRAKRRIEALSAEL